MSHVGQNSTRRKPQPPSSVRKLYAVRIAFHSPSGQRCHSIAPAAYPYLPATAARISVDASCRSSQSKSMPAGWIAAAAQQNSGSVNHLQRTAAVIVGGHRGGASRAGQADEGPIQSPHHCDCHGIIWLPVA